MNRPPARRLASHRTLLSRLSLLALLSILALPSLLCLGCSGAAMSPGGAKRVIVVGAGLAGLTAALDLRDAGWDVVVLEARDRVGGRVRTLFDGFSGGLHAEGGGESIDDNHDQIQALVARYGLSLEHRPADKQLGGAVYYQSMRFKTRDFALQTPGVANDYTRFSLDLVRLASGLDPEHPDRFARAAELDRRSLADFLTDEKLVAEAELLVRVANRAGYDAELADISLLFAAQQATVLDSVPDSASETLRITGGNSLLPQAMAADLGARVSLRSPVTRIAQSDAGMRVTAADRDVEGDCVVLAIPAPPLRRIVFSPPLPADLAAMAAELDLGPAAKVVTQYRSRFWTGLGLSGFTVTDLPFGVGWPPTDSYAGTEGLLSQFITGAPALDAAALDDATRIATFQKQLDRVYPEGVAEKTTNAATIAWRNEPYSGGGYTVYKPGQMTRFWPALRNGTAHLRFAGEHTESLAGFMESAVRSGHRVAKELGAPGGTCGPPSPH